MAIKHFNNNAVLLKSLSVLAIQLESFNLPDCKIDGHISVILSKDSGQKITFNVNVTEMNCVKMN